MLHIWPEPAQLLNAPTRREMSNFSHRERLASMQQGKGVGEEKGAVLKETVKLPTLWIYRCDG